MERRGTRFGWASGRRRSARGPPSIAALGLLIAFALAPMVASALPPAGVIVVSPSASAGWVVSTSADGGALTAASAFVPGPGTSPLGAGSLELSVGSNGDGGVQARQPGYAGIPLTSLTMLSYDTYVSVFAGCQAPYLILNVDQNFDGVTDDLLFFEPCYQTGEYSGNAVPAQGAPLLDTWQGWDALVGGWWSLNAGSFGPPLVTLASVVAAHPGTRIVNSPSGGGVRIVAGFGAGAWDDFVGDVDAFTIGVGSSTTTYDFEPAAAPVHLDMGSDSVIDFDFGTIQGAVNAANGGDTVLVDAGTYPELVVVAKDIALKGAQAGVAGWARGGASESVVGTTDGAFQVLADGVVIDGFTIQGVVGASGISSLGAGVWTSGEHSGTTIANNIIQGNTIGLYLNSGGGSPTTVSGNLFRDNNEPGAASGDAIYSDLGAVNVQIDGNHFTGHESSAMVFAGGFSPPEGLQSGITISDNEIANDAGSVVLFNAADVFILGNSWSHSGGSSVFLGGGVDGVTIAGNNFLDGDFRAVRVYAGAFGEPGVVTNVAVHENNIAGNAVAGIGVVAGSYVGTLQADCNWWGSASGPAASTNPGGLGDAIVDTDSVVNFVPWLSVPAPAPCTGFGGGPVHLDIGSNGVIDVNFGSIQPAVTTAGDGDTVLVDPGVYTEQVVIDAGIRLVSTVPGGATIQAPPFASRHTFTIPSSGRTWDAIVEVKDADDATVEGFVIDGNGQGGFCSGRSFTGIMMHGGVGMTARGNLVTAIRDTPFSGCQAGVGIAVYPDEEGAPASAEIAGNSIIRYQKGGIVVNVEGATADVHDNLVVGAGPTGVIAQNGIQFGFGAGGTAARNVVSLHAYTGGYWTSAGILLYGAADGVAIEDNLVENDQVGIDVWGSAGVLAAGNYVALAPTGLFGACGGPLGATDLFGIHFQDSSGRIVENEVRDIRFEPSARGCQSGDGIVLDGATVAFVAQNRVTGYQKTGIAAGRFSNDVDDSLLSAGIVGNTVVGWGMTDLIAQNGIQVADGAHAEVLGNDVSRNWYAPCGDYLTCYNAAGILVDGSAGVIMEDNVLSADQAGINLFLAPDAQVTHNEVAGSAWAVIVDSSDNVLVSDNEIGAPTVGPAAVQIVGIWALGSAGAYVRGNDLDFGGAVAPVDTLYGVWFDDASGTVEGNSVLRIRMSDAYFGLQTGIGVIATGTGDVDIVSNSIRNYQKGGIVAGRVSVPLVGVVNILDNTVVGVGPTPLIAQNGIQVSGREASGLVRGNHIEGNFYTGCSHHDAAKTGCIPWEATGLLLWDVFHGTLLKTSGNHYVDNQRNFYVLPAH